MHLMMSNKSPTTSSTASPPLLDGKTLKKEIPDDENIKDFAETAMNELLGWYGYDARGPRTASMKAGPPGSKSPSNLGTQSQNKSPSAEDNDVCAWCNTAITNDSNPLHQSMGEKFCSELCFSQSRRANFKRAKTCDWCRHIRHTVSYVDFQDGATQLQFCSDKCLNQYKMHIFCRETQAHLDLNPHLVNAATSNTNLITPDLWLKNCRSRSVSPSSEHSASPNNAGKVSADDAPQSPKSNLNSSSEIPTTNNTTQSSIKSTHPLITVAPTSKLMKTKPTLDEKLKIQNASEMRREHKILKVYSKRRRSSRCSSTVTSQNYLKHNNNNLPPMIKPQDLTIRSPSLSQDSSPNSSILHTPQSIIPSPPLPMNSRIPNMLPINFPNPMLNLPTPHPPTGPNTFPNQRSFRQPFYPQHNYNLPRPPPNLPHEQIRNIIPPPLQLGIGPPPPMTVLVPYPVILPLPLPIPIPIPIMDFVKAYEINKWPNEQTTDNKKGSENSPEEPTGSFSEEPIDFTMTTKRRCNNNTDTENKNERHEDTAITNDIVNNDSNNETENVQSEFSGHLESVDSGNPEQTLPRFKITRLGAKMSKIVLPKAKEVSESTRPLRKRRRLVDVPSEEECNSVTNKTRKTVHA